MNKIVSIVGARPQFIKYFAVSRAIASFNNKSGPINDILIHTGQHYDYRMSKIFFDELDIKNPDYHLGVGSGLQGKQTAQIIYKTEEVLIKENPDIVLVYGDTNSTLGGALAAAKLHIPLAHVEAGFRSFNKYMPEEINRILTDHISTVLFCPSKTAVQNLEKEGFKNIANNSKLYTLDFSLENEIAFTNINKNNPLVINVGDVMYDTLLGSIPIAQEKSDVLNRLKINPKEYYLLTLHRTENTDNLKKFEELVDFINRVSFGKKVVFPIHPRTKKVYDNSAKKFSDNIIIIEPTSYFDTLVLLKSSAMVMTDSGGIQQEAYWLKVPCITLRGETERVETLQSGWNILYKDYKGQHSPTDENINCYGDGDASLRIVKTLLEFIR